ncbi:MAG: hypothetical protein KIS76_00480 [Pyrinomonadaceae bacterium]|nr:hypothetical protein [Pyrinomonadaceae bacterium]
MAEKKTKVTRKLVRAGGWNVARRLLKSIPGVGTAMVIGFVGYDIKRKGLTKGLVNSGLDAIPIIGTGKNLLEIITGDLIKDKPAETSKKLPIKEKDDEKH